jgi:hypothetical protein
MFRLNPTRSERARQVRIRQEARYLKYWLLKVRAAGFVLALALALAAHQARADASTGLADDPKDMSYQSTTTTTTTTDVMSMSSPFLPLPSWSRFEKMPPLPDQLKPLGKKPAEPVPLATTPVILRKDPGEQTPSVFIPKPKDIPVVNNNPTLIAVSPFLQWVKDHPKDATAQARKEAAIYNPQAPVAGANAPNSEGGSGSPYWMPPLVDSGDTTAPASSSSTTTGNGGSAAIYSTPQRN